MANELDVSVDFESWMVEEAPFRLRKSDPFHLYRNEAADCMEGYFDPESGVFDKSKFSEDFLRAIEKALDSIFESGAAPRRLRRIRTNEEHRAVACKSCLQMDERDTGPLRKQCEQCTVAVSQVIKTALVGLLKSFYFVLLQTKIGACLQFQWQLDGFQAMKSDQLRRLAQCKSVYCSIDLVPMFRYIEDGITIVLVTLHNSCALGSLA